MSSSDAFWLNVWGSVAAIGFIIVIIGVVIEGVEHFKKFPKKDQARKLHIEKIGWFLVVGGLAMEFLGDHAAKRISDRESARLNEDAAEARKEAGQAKLQVVVLSNETVRLSVNLEESKSNSLELAKQVFGLATQTELMSTHIEQVRDMANSPEITAKLNETKQSLAAANKTMADVKDILTSSNLEALSQLKPKSLQERIIECLNSINQSLIPQLASHTSLECSGEMDREKFSALRKLAAEAGAWKYLQIDEDASYGVKFMNDATFVTTGVNFWIYPALLKKE